MTVTNLTQGMVDRLGPSTKLTKDGSPTHTVIWDTLLPSFGIRISPNGKKSWIANTWPNGKFTPVTLGSTAIIPRIAQARDLAREAMLKAKAGINPIEAKRQQTEAEKAATYTLQSLIDDYLAWSRANHRLKTYQQNWELLCRMLAIADFADQPAASITPVEIKAFGDAVKPGQRGEIERWNQIRLLGRMYNWAVERGKLPGNPVARIKILAKPKLRTRLLSHVELKAFWQASGVLGWPFGPFFQLLALLGQRRSETAEMTWNELDLEAGVWTLPARRANNKREQRVPLPQTAVNILRGLPRFRGSRFVFTTTGSRPINGFGWAKYRVAQAMGSNDWTLEDLRRSMTKARHDLAQETLQMVRQTGFDITAYLPINEHPPANERTTP
jgi:integrase